MDSHLHRVGLFALLAGTLLLAGCAAGPRAARPAARSGERPVDREQPKGEGEASEEALERRVRAVSHFAAGISAELNDDDRGALEHYLKSAAADPGHEVLVLELARRLIQNKQLEEAIALLSKAAASPRASGTTFAWLGLALAEAEKTEPAIKADLAAIARAPDLMMGYRNLFNIYQVNHESGEALKVLDQAAGQSSDEPEFWVDLADLYANSYQLHPEESAAVKPKVMAALEHAMGLKPQNLMLLQKLADGYKSLAEFGRAEEVYLQLLDRFPSLPGTREKLA